MEVVAIALALALGFLVGLGVGFLRGIRLEARRRAIAGASGALARLWPAELPERSAADILAGIIRVMLGGQQFNLPVLSRAASREWLANLDARFVALAGDLESAADDAPRIMTRLVAEADGLLDMLIAYDQTHVLPPRDVIDMAATDTEILRACIEVWRATNPLAATLVEMASPTSGLPPEPPNSPPQPTAGTPPPLSAL